MFEKGEISCKCICGEELNFKLDIWKNENEDCPEHELIIIVERCNCEPQIKEELKKIK
jgi:hypothetical protein